MMTALYSLPHGVRVEPDGTWHVPATGQAGRLESVDIAVDVIGWNMAASGGASYRRQDLVCRWELPVQVYIAIAP